MKHPLLERAAAFVRAHPRGVAYAIALAIHLVIAPFLIHDWDGFVFITSARDMLHGQSPYRTAELAPPYIFVGDGVPVVNSWYAYPPVPLLLMTVSYAASTLLFGGAPWVERVGVKLPWILGDLALAYVTYRFIRAAFPDAPESRARNVERFLLFNPFLIFVSAAWGMFDATMMALAIASAWMLYERRPVASAVLFALAVLVKPFPALLIPPFAVFAARLGGARALAKWVATGAATGVAVSLPFFLSAPTGFVEQVFLGHLGRPPQGFTLFGIPLAFPWINGLFGTSLPTGIGPETLSRWSFFVLVVILGVVSIQALRVRTASDLAHLSLVALVAMLLASKVVNEQYFVMPVAAAALAYGLDPTPLHLWTRRLYTIGGFASGIFLGYHFLTFIPVDVARVIFPFDPTSTVPRLTWALHLTADQAYAFPTLIAAASLVPALIVSLVLVARNVALPVREMREALAAGLRVSRTTVTLLVALLVVAPAMGVLVARAPASDPEADYVAPTLPMVGAIYSLGWNNPSHDPRIDYGNWERGVSETPVDGYFTTSAGKMRNDFLAMKANGIDLVAYSYHPYDKPKLPAIVRLAIVANVTTAPVVELGDLLQDPDARSHYANGTARSVDWGFSMRDETANAIADLIAGPLVEVSHFPSWWKIDGTPVVFLHPSEAVFYDGSGPTRERLIDRAFALAWADANATGTSPPTRDSLAATVPDSPDALREPGAALWRRAYHDAVRQFWSEVERDVAEKVRPITLLASAPWDPDRGADRGASLALAREGTVGSFIASPSDLWQAHFGASYAQQAARWDEAALLEGQHERASASPVVASVTPGHDDRALRGNQSFVVPYVDAGTSTLARSWKAATSAHPDVILVDSWNRFDDGTAIEPTEEHGDAFLRMTHELASAWTRTPRPGADVLLLTNLLGASYKNATGDPDGSYAFSVLLEGSAERTFHGRVAAVEWNGPLLAATDLSAYKLIIVEPGLKEPWTPAAEAIVERLNAAMDNGTRVLLLGSDVGTTFARLAPWSEPPLPSSRWALVTPSAEIPVPIDAWTRRHVLPADAMVLLSMTDGSSRLPALWSVPHGKGSLGVTSFRPQGTSAGEADPALFPAVIRAFAPGLLS